jgi:outer membrane protein assembly factor BamB
MRRPILTTALWSLLLSTAYCLPPAARADWPRFRGPNGSGIAAGAHPPAQFTGKDLAWKIDLPGIGHSSPIVVGEKVFVTCADPATATRYLICVSLADGKELWRREYASHRYAIHRDNSFASSSPTADDSRVYYTIVTPDSYKVYAADHAGKELWSYEMGPWKSEHGPGASPILFEDLLILSNDQDGPTASLVALDKTTGSERWRINRKSGRAAASTPCLFTPPGGGPAQLILTCTGSGISSIDPRTGHVNWSTMPAPRSYRSVGSPVAGGRWVVGSWGEGQSGPNRVVLALQPDAAPTHEPRELLKLTKTPNYPYVPTPLLDGDRLYIWADVGTVTCLKMPGGEVVWQQKVKGSAGRTEFYASPILADGRLYNITKDGEVICLAAGDTFKDLGHSPLNDRCYATPAVAGDRLVIRTASHLMAIGPRVARASRP